MKVNQSLFQQKWQVSFIMIMIIISIIIIINSAPYIYIVKEGGYYTVAQDINFIFDWQNNNYYIVFGMMENGR